MIELFKSRLRSYPYLYQGLKQLYKPIQIWRSIRIKKNKNLLPQQIEQALKNNPSVFFIQIGANDGKTGDPLYPLIMAHSNWEGIFIEPVKHIFEKLKDNYKVTNKLIFENVAIANDYSVKKFYYVSEEAKNIIKDVPHWYDKLGSFDKTHIIKHYSGKFEPFIVEEDIICVPIKGILNGYKVDKIDLIQIDTEGFDYQILAQFDLIKYHPKVIMFEHKHLSAKEKYNAIKLLQRSAYKLYDSGENYLAIKSNNIIYLFFVQLFYKLLNNK